MKNQIIERTIRIQASQDQVWRVFVDPALTRMMGGAYDTDWNVGSSFGWKGVDGPIATHGILLRLEPGKLLQHSLFAAADDPTIISVITYRLEGDQDATILHGKEEVMEPLTEEAYEEAVQGWDAALNAVRLLAEGHRI